MRKINLTLIFLTALFSYCNFKSESARPIQLDGEFNWAYTRGERDGKEYYLTPDSLNRHEKFIFDRGMMIFFINNRENKRYPYHIARDTLRYGSHKFHIKKTSDSLFLMNARCCEHVFKKVLVQKIYR